jgi:protein required for attachment to host cells
MYGLYRVEFHRKEVEDEHVIAAIAADALTLVQDKHNGYKIKRIVAISNENTLAAVRPQLRRGLPRIMPSELFKSLTEREVEVA